MYVYPISCQHSWVKFSLEYSDVLKIKLQKHVTALCKNKINAMLLAKKAHSKPLTNAYWNP